MRFVSLYNSLNNNIIILISYGPSFTFNSLISGLTYLFLINFSYLSFYLLFSFISYCSVSSAGWSKSVRETIKKCNMVSVNLFLFGFNLKICSYKFTINYHVPTSSRLWSLNYWNLFIFFILSGLHFFHIIVGLMFLGIRCNFPETFDSLFLRISQDLYFTIQVLYWHFVEMIWLFIFIYLYSYSIPIQNAFPP